jgi:group I intron endonuclease
MANLNSQKKYHYIYKTTNLINGKFYVGMHSTNNLKDGYLGSGKKLRYSIRKYGTENFKIEYLEFFDNRIDLANREKELVTEDLLKDPMCMNLKSGGDGGCAGEAAMKWSKAGIAKRKWLFENEPNFRKEVNQATSIRTKILWENGKFDLHFNNKYWVGKSHREDSKRKIGEANKLKQSGSANSQFGTCWITNGTENKKIKKTEKLPEGWEFGRK